MSSKEKRDSDPFIGKKIRTTEECVTDWSEEASRARKWDVTGIVCDLSNSHGNCYFVKHDDGSYAWYDSGEFDLVDEKPIQDNDFIQAEIVNNKFAGKTILKVDATAINCWYFYFTDGSYLAIEVEAVLPSIGLYGISVMENAEMPEESNG